jgi:hypothetical protein
VVGVKNAHRPKCQVIGLTVLASSMPRVCANPTGRQNIKNCRLGPVAARGGHVFRHRQIGSPLKAGSAH